MMTDENDKNDEMILETPNKTYFGGRMIQHTPLQVGSSLHTLAHALYALIFFFSSFFFYIQFTNNSLIKPRTTLNSFDFNF
jgi:hypothetical protein